MSLEIEGLPQIRDQIVRVLDPQMLAWDIRQGRLIEEPTEPKLTAMANSRAASTILAERSGSPVVKLTPIPDRSPDARGSRGSRAWSSL